MSLVCLADNQEYQRLQAFVMDACARGGCSSRQRLRVMLLIEELFTNTVQHGRRGDAPVDVALTFTLHPGADIDICYEDGAARYDPFQRAHSRHSLDDSVELRPLGGLGVLLIQELGKDVRYAWVDGKNRVTFSIPPEPLPEQRR